MELINTGFKSFDDSLSIGEAVSIAIEESYEDLIRFNEFTDSVDVKEFKLMQEKSFTEEDHAAYCESMVDMAKEFIKNLIAKIKAKFNKFKMFVRQKFIKLYTLNFKNINVNEVNKAYEKLKAADKLPIVKYPTFNDAKDRPQSYASFFDFMIYTLRFINSKLSKDSDDVSDKEFSDDVNRMFKLENGNFTAAPQMWAGLDMALNNVNKIHKDLDNVFNSVLEKVKNSTSDQKEAARKIIETEANMYKLFGTILKLCIRYLQCTYNAIIIVLNAANKLEE